MDTWTYAPAPESAALARLQPTYRPYVDGAFVDGGGEPLKTVNPATEEVLAEVGTADESDVDRAVAAARRAFERTWGPMPAIRRELRMRLEAAGVLGGDGGWRRRLATLAVGREPAPEHRS